MKVNPLANVKDGKSNPPPEKLAYSMREAAQALGVSYITIHRLLKRGLLKSSSALRTKVIPRSQLEQFLANTCE